MSVRLENSSNGVTLSHRIRFSKANTEKTRVRFYTVRPSSDYSMLQKTEMYEKQFSPSYFYKFRKSTSVLSLKKLLYPNFLLILNSVIIIIIGISTDLWMAPF